MQQYFYPNAVESDLIVLDDNQNHHIKNVIKLKPNTKVRIVDNLNRVFIGQVEYAPEVMITQLSQIEEKNELAIKITLIAALIKKDKWDILIQKVSELGVYQIVGMNTSRCVVKLDEKKEKKLLRWNKITMEACEQSRRSHLVEVVDVIEFNDIEKYLSDENVIAYEDIEHVSLKLKDLDSNMKSITILIGPEGGFSEKEVQKAMDLGFKPITLGKRILRAETAAIAAVNGIGVLYE